MTMKKYTVPNWGQALIAKAKGLDPRELSVINDSDYLISFLEHKTRNNYLIDKRDGSVKVTEPQRLYGYEKGGAPTVQSRAPLVKK